MATNAEQLEKEMQTLRAEVERLRADLGSIVGTAGDLASGAGSVAAEKVRKTVERAGAKRSGPAPRSPRRSRSGR